MARTLLTARSAEGSATGKEHLLGLLEADHDRIGDLIGLLEHERQPAARACLAKELMRACAATEDVRRRTIYRHLYSTKASAAAREERCKRIRSLLRSIDSYTHRVLPSNVHAHDGEGFEATIAEVVSAMREHLQAEQAELQARVASMTSAEAHAVAQAVLRARRNAMTRPHAHMGRVLRGLRRQLDRLHDIEDAPDYFLRDFRIELRRAG